ncbi:beta-L-arabinofuranosidase domain-containing protein [Candidatus Korobacter versatilis]|uniref:beta-L-arabinofuranosidase domain-containing protein n=1 Tax=Candidatus Korobacter versatilis TaxID=658062 RepID=UPI001E31AA83|nr:beta-L-arabinofuranosidase domain-containing protein [Candidatus Koribacter versatilis]
MSSASLAAASLPFLRSSAFAISSVPLDEFGYGDVSLESELHNRQFQNTHDVLMGLEDDALLKPFRAMVGQPPPGRDLGGWYCFDPNYNPNDVGVGFAPTATFGQWISALSRSYALRPDPAVRDKVIRLNRLYAQTISPEFYGLKNRFPAYCYDKLVCGLIDAHQYVGDPDALKILERTTDTATPLLPGHAVEHGTVWRSVKDDGYTWDESYTISENLFLAYRRGAGDRYRALGKQYLDDTYYNPLAEGRSDLEGRHAYSHVNSLCSAMQAYLTLGDEKYFRAAKNGFDFVLAQSYATGGWGADETLRAPNSPEVAKSLTGTHHSFETPCGSYAHFKLTRYLLRVTRDSRYGDSMERVMYNTILGALPLMPDGRTFYYSDYNFKGSKFYHDARWPCCSGTMPQIATDYGISTYLRDPQGIYVNLYIPSTVRWQQDGAQVSLTQKTAYPFDPVVEIELSTTKQREFEVHLRIPAWAEQASIEVNGKREGVPVAERFATIRRTWKNGDRIQLELPLKNRLEPLNRERAKLVALLNGPLVLFPIGEKAQQLTQGQLLAAKRAGSAWRAESTGGPVKLLPWTEIQDQPYSTYVQLA